MALNLQSPSIIPAYTEADMQRYGEALEQARALRTETIDHGTLSDLRWLGGVSASGLIEVGTYSEQMIDEAFGRISQGDYHVPVNPKAKTRCIDGRLDELLEEMFLGPQVPGGVPGAAFAYKLGVNTDSLTSGNFLGDAKKMIGSYIRLGFAPGGHRDRHSVGKSAVGCGAIDGMDRVLSVMVDPEYVEDHKRVVETVFGKNFDRDRYLRVLGAATVLKGNTGYFDGREKIIDYLEDKAPNSVATLEGDHQECLVVINLVPGTTFNSNKFAEDFKGMQAFGYDLWRSMEMAQRLFPRSDQEDDRHNFVMARVMTTIATLMALTDGTQRLIVRMPEKNQPQVEVSTRQ